MYLSVSEQGAYLKKDGERLIIEKNKVQLDTVHIRGLTGIQLFGNIQVSTQLVQKLMAEGIEIHYLSRNGYMYGNTSQLKSINYQAKMAQLHCFSLEQLQLQFAKLAICAKLKGQIHVLQIRRHKVKNEKMKKTIDKLRKLQKKVQNAEKFKSLLGFEGVATKYYFSTFDDFLPVDFSFEKRSRRPAHNAMNSLMNYQYSLLQSDMTFVIRKGGLDEYIGFHHQKRYSRTSLVFDLMEIFRPIVDCHLISLIRNKKITSRYIDVQDEFRLTDEGRRLYLQYWYEWKRDVNFIAILEIVVEGLKKSYIEQDGRHFNAAIGKALSYLL